MLLIKTMTDMPTQALSGTPSQKSRTTALIAALDQHRIRHGAAHRLLNVLGVHTDRQTLWIQVAHSDDSSEALVLHLSLDATAEDAIRVLEMAPRDGDHYPRIVEVAHAT